MVFAAAHRRPASRGRLVGRWLTLALPIVLMRTDWVSSGSAIRLERISGASPYARCQGGGGGKNYSGSQLQAVIAGIPRTSPTRPELLTVWAQDPWSNGGARGLMAAVSTNGGRRWRARPVPFGACARKRSSILRVGSPSLAIGPDGMAYLAASGTSAASLSTGGSAGSEAAFDTLLLATSSNGATVWTRVQAIPFGQNVSTVSIAADQRRRGTAYVVWQSAMGSWFSRTSDAGATWSRPRVIVQGQPMLPAPTGNVLLVDPRTGALHLVYDYIRPLRKPRMYCGRWRGRRECYTFRAPPELAPSAADITVISSRDGGKSWSLPQFIARDLGVGRIGPRPSRWSWMAWHRPAAALDPRTGRISIVWQDSRFTVGRYDEIALSVSDGDGRHWSSPVRVDRGQGPAVLPSVTVNARGVTGIAYYQIRGLPAGSSIPPLDYWFRTAPSPTRLGAPQRLAGPLALGRLPLAFDPFAVHEEGMTSVGATFYAVFITTVPGDSHTNLVSATIS